MGGGREGDYIPIASLSSQNNFCIKMGSDESHFNVSLIVRDKVTRRVSTNHKLSEGRREPKRNRAELGPSAYQPSVLPLGETGSLRLSQLMEW